MAKSKNVRKGFQDTDSALSELRKTSAVLKLGRSLTKDQSLRLSHHLGEAPAKLSRATFKYYNFIGKVSGVAPEYVELCKAAFSKTRIESTKESVLNEIVKMIQEAQHNASLDPTLTRIQEGQNNVISSKTNETIEFTYAEREGIKEVWGEYWADVIKAAEIRDSWRAVSIRLPRRPNHHLTSCITSLDVRNEYVEEVAMALFGIIVYVEPDSKFKMSGVLDKNIIDVFGSDTYNAIAVSPERKEELKKGVSRTQCVSMTLSKGKCTINLTLSLMEGVMIQKRLWATAARQLN
jgi:hypothetical protein